jgi:hypothetical protein
MVRNWREKYRAASSLKILIRVLMLIGSFSLCAKQHRVRGHASRGTGVLTDLLTGTFIMVGGFLNSACALCRYSHASFSRHGHFPRVHRTFISGSAFVSNLAASGKFQTVMAGIFLVGDSLG